jgi:tetratricopeptide (TPR) repeat protein
VFLAVGYIHYHMGRIAHHLGDLKNALQRYEHSREIFEKSPEENEKMLVRLYTLIGDIHSLFGSTKEAQNCYEKAMIFVKGNPLFNDEEKKLLAEKIASLKKSIESNTQ